MSGRIDDLEELIYEVKSSLRNNDIKPHKCPVCEGKCKQIHPLIGLLCSACDACEGKGIVWG